MILVDVQVPALDRTFDFVLNEEALAGEVMKEILQLIKERVKNIRQLEDKLYLYAFYKEQLLDEKLSLQEQGIVAGEKLILL